MIKYGSTSSLLSALGYCLFYIGLSRGEDRLSGLEFRSFLRRTM